MLYFFISFITARFLINSIIKNFAVMQGCENNPNLFLNNISA